MTRQSPQTTSYFLFKRPIAVPLRYLPISMSNRLIKITNLKMDPIRKMVSLKKVKAINCIDCILRHLFHLIQNKEVLCQLQISKSTYSKLSLMTMKKSQCNKSQFCKIQQLAVLNQNNHHLKIIAVISMFYPLLLHLIFLVLR